jgi:hypoxia up-regulated 1
LAERHYPIVPKYNETRNGLTLQIDGISFTPEELVAMVLTHAVDISVAYAAEGGNTILPPKDVVLTVPSYSTIVERRALLDASSLVDLNVLLFIDENTAAALHYAMDKTFDVYPNNTQTILFYNLGASSLQISIIKFYNYLHPQKYGQPKSIPTLEVISKAWDTTCGGDAFDHIIVEYLADQFNIVYQKVYPNQVNFDVRNYTRPMTKLRIQANKIKHVLSANTNIPIYMDSVHDDVSLQTQLTREQFESMVEPLIQRATSIPIQKALKIANLTMDQLTGIELLGGGMRIPRIQNELQSLLPKHMELGYHINSDESFALGAAFAGANISMAFRVRQVGMIDINPFPIGITLTNLPSTNETKLDSSSTKTKEEEEDDTKGWTKTATIFKAFGKIGVKKTIAFTHTQNIHCGLDYINDTSTQESLLPNGTELPLVRYNITGVPEFITDMEQQYNITNIKPKISLQFELSTSGLVSLIKAEAAIEETYMVQEEIEIEDGNVTDSNTTNTTLNTTDSDNTTTTTTTENKENITDSDNLNTTTGTTSNDTSANTTMNATSTPPKRKMLVDKVCSIYLSLLFSKYLFLFSTIVVTVCIFEAVKE